jgi:hypothetical protein
MLAVLLAMQAVASELAGDLGEVPWELQALE